MTPVELADIIRERAPRQGRFLTALAGPPGAGKSTLAAELVVALGAALRVVLLFALDLALGLGGTNMVS